jgi:beta-lactamase class C
MKRREFLREAAGFAASAALLRPFLSRAAANNVSDPIAQCQQAIDDYVSKRQDRGLPTAVAAGLVCPQAPNGQLLFGGGNTLLSATHQPLPLNSETFFEIGSNTKPFTSLIQFSRHGDYCGSLGDFITAYPMSSDVARIPLIDLANYSSGLPQDSSGGYWPNGAMDNLDGLFSWLSAYNLPNCPGSCYSYSNLGWSLLGMAAVGLENRTNDIYNRYDTALKSMIASKSLGLLKTGLYQPWMNPGLPIGYIRPGEPAPIGSPYYDPLYGFRMLFGGGSIVSTPGDMFRWLLANMGYGGVELDTLAAQQQPVWYLAECQPGGRFPANLGWFDLALTVDGQPKNILYKDGWVNYFSSWMGFEQWIDSGQPSATGVFVLSNSSLDETTFTLGNLGVQMTEILLGGASAGGQPPGALGSLPRG